MKLETASSQPYQLVDQPTHWPRFYVLPETNYVKRQRAANAHEYNPMPKAEVSQREVTSRMPPFLQRGINRLTEARRQAWLSLKRVGREVVHKMAKWFWLPLAIAACVAITDVSPAELPTASFTSDQEAVMKR